MFDLANIKLNQGVFYYKGNPPLIVNLNRERKCKLLLSSHEEIELLSLVLQKRNQNNKHFYSNDKMVNRVLGWLDEKILIKEGLDSEKEGKAKDPFFTLFRELLSTRLLAKERHSLATYHKETITDPVKQFEDEEITLSHVYRRPHPALGGLSYGARFAEMCCQTGSLKSRAKILEVGGGVGFFGNNFLSYIRKNHPDIYDTIHYTFLDLSSTLLSSQQRLNESHKERTAFIEGNIENYDFGRNQFDLVIANEMIADLEVAKLKKSFFFSDESPSGSLEEVVAFCKRCGLNFEDAFDEFLVNIGAFRCITKFKEILSPDGKAIIVEYGNLHSYPNASVLKGHTEFSIHFGHLIRVAKSLGFRVDFSNMLNFMGFKEDVKVLDLLSFMALKEHLLPFFNKQISHFAYTKEILRKEIGEELVSQIEGLRFSNISEASATVNPQHFLVLIIACK